MHPKQNGAAAGLVEFGPGANPIDNRSLRHAKGWGRAARRDIIKGLVQNHGMTPEQADAHFAQRNALSPGAKAEGAHLTILSMRLRLFFRLFT